MGDGADDARYYEERMQFEKQARMDTADAEALKAARPLVEHPEYRGLMMKADPVAVVGIPYPNPDGTSRMDTCLAIPIGALVKLVREPNNAYDRNKEDPTFSNALAVYVAEGNWPEVFHTEYNPSGQLGYLPAGLAAYYQPLIDNDELQLYGVVTDKVSKVPGGKLTHLKIALGILEEVSDASVPTTVG